ncbi:alpha/beta fold hydrolase [Rhizobium herbae]|uniref:Pimeloyl-ACP methyl ester carboxylesterase n=1 Tax=Rhizobium herbae TaxID=508661 RepID=A0ABS4ERU1_9HYPH|nr:alpha/beta hydrolase [Rhizobium herbae]MBP1860643.1 pimeloyl-ACP methyl ester carboxylesterase [Rhizobium herbae]
MTNTIGTSFEERYFSAGDGLQLYARDYGHDDPRTQQSLPVVCLPGLSRNSRDFHLLAMQLSTHREKPRRVVALDYRGRGFSAWDPDKSHYQLPVEAEDVLTACAVLDISQAIFIGTSRGGLILHLLAAMRPALLHGVVLNDIGPVIEVAGLLLIRQYLEAQEVLHSWEEAIANLQRVHGAAFPTLDQADWRDMAEAIFREKDGVIIADFDPALIEPLRSVEPNTAVPDLWALYEGLKAVPLMAVRGENSTILSEKTFAEMAQRHPGMSAVTAQGQGHAPLLHRPELAVEIRAFIDGIS